MGTGRIVCALANPDPEITPQEAGPHVDVMATGRSDYANQINNVLCFPGFFRGMLDVRAHGVSDSMKIAAADAIAGVISDNQIHPDYVIPSVFDRRVSKAVAQAVAQAAIEANLARKESRSSI
jgi:malate dehydrogenase (oxaloacetate-decarboxylating)